MPSLTEPNADLMANPQYRQIIATTHACKKAAALITTQPLPDRNSYLLFIVQCVIEAEPFGDLRDDLLVCFCDEINNQSASPLIANEPD